MNYVNSIRLNILLIFWNLTRSCPHKDLSLWDDDTDISLARDEFEKLYKVLKMRIIPTTN